MIFCFQYRDPLIGVLDYIVKVGILIFSCICTYRLRKKCPNTVAIARDDDLRLVKEVSV
jgi:uncharacterized membrane protein